MSKFKIGDKVRIIEDATLWCNDGEKTVVEYYLGYKSAVGKVGVVKKSCNREITVGGLPEECGVSWNYELHQIELVSEYSPAIEPPTGEAPLKVRPLEWAFNKSKTILGTIEVYVSGFHYDGEPKYGFQKGDYIDDGIYNSPKEAQQAAEAWYRLSLLSCFEGYTLEEKAVEIVSNVTEFKPLYMHHNSEGQHRIYTQEEIDGFKSNRATDSNEG